MDAILYLRNEHSRFRKTLAAINKTSNEKLKLRKFTNFCQDLVRHEKMEQTKWYPVLRKNVQLRDVIKHLLKEEKNAAKNISKFKKIKFGMIWTLKFKKFKYDVDHHARQEERELFPKVRKILDKSQLNILGTKMRKFKMSLKAKG